MTRKTGLTLPRGFALAFATALAAGCAMQPLPAEEMSLARAAVAQAVLVGGTAPELARSREKLALAQRWVDARDFGPARWLAEQAEVDAELAVARAASQDARRALAQRDPTHLAMLKTSGKPK